MILNTHFMCLSCIKHIFCSSIAINMFRCVITECENYLSVH